MNASGGKARVMTPPTFDAHVPSWSHDGTWMYFAANRTGRYEIWRMPAAGGESAQVTTEGGTVAVEGWDRQTLYYTKAPFRFGPAETQLYARPLAGGPERLVVGAVENHGFFIAERGIYYIRRSPGGSEHLLQFFDFAGGRSRTLTRMDTEPYWRLAVSPDSRTVLFGATRAMAGDLMLIANFR
jgi:hypothetical protein